MATLWDRPSVQHRVPSVNAPTATPHQNIVTTLISSLITNQAVAPHQRTHTSLGTFFGTNLTGRRTLNDPYQYLLRFGDGGKFPARPKRGNYYELGGRL